jgi:hypothetical protein
MSLLQSTGGDTLFGDIASLLDSFEADNESSGGLPDTGDALQEEWAPTTAFESRLAMVYGDQHQLQASRANRKKRKYKRGYSTQLLQRKKAEVVELRRQIKELEGWLLQHRRNAERIKTSSSSESSHGDDPKRRNYWAAKSLEEFRKLQQSRQVNQKLKEIMGNQVRLAKTHQAALQKALEEDPGQ